MWCEMLVIVMCIRKFSLAVLHSLVAWHWICVRTGFRFELLTLRDTRRGQLEAEGGEVGG